MVKSYLLQLSSLLLICPAAMSQGGTPAPPSEPPTVTVSPEGLGLLNDWASVLVGTTDPEDPTKSKAKASNQKPGKGEYWNAKTDGDPGEEYIYIDVEAVIAKYGVNTKYGAGQAILLVLMHEHIHVLGYGAGPVYSSQPPMFPKLQCEHLQMYFALYKGLCDEIVRFEAWMLDAETLAEYNAYLFKQKELCKIAGVEKGYIDQMGALLAHCADKTAEFYAGNVFMPDLDDLQAGVDQCDYCE